MASNVYPVGTALHQWKRGKEFRRLIRPPAGYDLLEFDFAGQEFRWMAVASKDDSMLHLCSPGEDAHSFMGARVAGIDYRELIRLVKEEDETANYQRKLGKFCVAEGEMVLTSRGLVPIEKVSLDMRVWDGVEWVAHEGLIYQGEREVITYEGLTATPDHMVYLQDGSSCEFGIAASQGSSLAKTGDSGIPLRLDADTVQRSAQRGFEKQSEAGLHMPEMSEAGLGQQRQLQGRQNHSVQELPEYRTALKPRTRYNQQCSFEAVAEKVQFHAESVQQPKRSVIQELRGARDSIQIWIGSGSHKLHLKRSSTPDILEAGHRPQGKQRPLRTRKPETGESSGESQQQAYNQVRRLQRDVNTETACVPCTENTTSRSDVFTADSDTTHKQRVGCTPDSRAVVNAKLQTKRTYDLTNAGPRHRFTVSNYLIFNCNLSYQYRVGTKTALQKARTDYEMDLDEVFIKQTLATYKESYRGVTDYWRNQISKCRMLGYAETFAGRRVQLKKSWTGRDAWPQESTAINYPIQGTGADQKYLALAVLRNILPKYNGYLYMELHDGLFVIIPSDRSRIAGPEIQRALSNLPYKRAWGIDLPIQFPVDSKISSESWGDLKNL